MRMPGPTCFIPTRFSLDYLLISLNFNPTDQRLGFVDCDGLNENALRVKGELSSNVPQSGKSVARRGKEQLSNRAKKGYDLLAF